VTSDLPLRAIRVLDLTRNVAGPFAAMILAELGADVVKVEHPATGDDARQWGPPFWGGETPTFLALNRNKRSVALDLHAADARTVMERLVDACDVLIESFRPGVLDRLGYGYEWASSRNPRLVYCSVTPFGDRGPLKERPGYDPLMQAFGGLMSVTGERGRPPVRSGTSLVDMGTGMWAAIAVLAALARRETTGRGQRVVASLYETALMWMTYHLTAYWASGVSPQRAGSGTAMIAPYEAFATRDGYLVIAAGNDRLFGLLCEVLGRIEWAQDDRFLRNEDRVRNRDVLHTEIEAVTREWSTDRLAAALDQAGVPASPIRSAAEVASDPQAQALGIFQTGSHPAIPQFLSVGLPLLFEGKRPPLRRHPPTRGEHTREVLVELDFPPDEVEALMRSPAVAGARAAGPTPGARSGITARRNGADG
jgi:crotonobetainyl-CoA:carnitine CoA-transferase CaiB-like acyl-CoA transferase